LVPDLEKVIRRWTDTGRLAQELAKVEAPWPPGSLVTDPSP